MQTTFQVGKRRLNPRGLGSEVSGVPIWVGLFTTLVPDEMGT